MKNNKFANLMVSNPAPRIPVVIIADVSGSMKGNPIGRMNAGVRQLVADLQQDECTRFSAELEVILFADEAERVLPFSPVNTIGEVPEFTASGRTVLGPALEMAMEDINERRKEYVAAGIPSYKPLVIVMGDGEFNSGDWHTPAAKLRSLAENGKCFYYAVMVGEDCNLHQFREIVPSEPGPFQLNAIANFADLFEWISDSVTRLAEGSVSEQDDVKFAPVSSWARI